MSLFAELKRRNVIRVGLAYLVASWLLIEASSLILDIYQAPVWISQVIVALLAVGFPVALIFSWAFEMTPEGLKRESEIPPDASIATHAAKKLDIAVIVLLVLAISLFGAERTGLLGPGADEPATMPEPGVARVADEQPRAIAVLPFTDMSPGADQGYFADGISEEILNLLAKNRELRVVARTSAFQFRDAADMRAVGEALDADRILEGSVRTSGTRVRITAQLIDAEEGYHLWSETYDRELTDIFAVQDEIAGAITEQLGVHLGITASAQVELGADAEAYRLYLQGRQAFNERAAPGRLDDAIDLLSRAIGTDPNLAAAHGNLSLAWGLSPWYTRTPVPEAEELALRAADRALKLDPENVEALVGKGYALAFLSRQVGEGREWMEAALALRPNDVTANNLMGDIYRLVGDRDGAIRYESRALELDPLNAVHNWDLGWAHAEHGEWEAAYPYMLRSTELEPQNHFSLSGEIWCLLFMGDPDAARERYRAYSDRGGYQAAVRLMDGVMLAVVMDDAEQVESAYRRALSGMEAHGIASGVRSMLAYQAGDFDTARRLLQEAIDTGDPTWLTFGPNQLGMFRDLMEAGYELRISEEFEALHETREGSDWAKLASHRERLLALREQYRGQR